MSADSTTTATLPPLSPAPVLSAEQLELLGLQELREHRRVLTERENRVSYWRRIMQARIDLVRTGALRRGASIEGLQEVLSQQLGTNSRKAHLPVQRQSNEIDGMDDELAELWATVDTEHIGDERLLTELQAVERQLSDQRNALHDGIDAATAELIRRYRENPELVATALPTRAARPMPL